MKAVMMLTVMSAVTMVLVLPNQAYANDSDKDVKKPKRLRKDVEELTKVVNSLKSKLETVESTFQTTKAQQATLSTRITSVETRAKNQGSSFVHWGRKSCPSTSTLVYFGIWGGKYYTQKGAGTNMLCLTRTPKYDNKSGSGYSYLYGGEYQAINNLFYRDAVCSVCLARQSTTIMVPGTYLCPAGWTRQYYGHLVASYKDSYATEYVCLDGKPEEDIGGSVSYYGVLIDYVQTVCGSLPCPPYVNNKVATCAVCSK